MFGLLLLGAPAATAAALTLLTPRQFRRPSLLLAVGIAVAGAFFLFQFLQAPPDFQHSHGDSDGELFWGRWWEPGFTLFLMVVGYACWVVGVAAGLLVGSGVARARRRSDEADRLP